MFPGFCSQPLERSRLLVFLDRAFGWRALAALPEDPGNSPSVLRFPLSELRPGEY